MTREGLTEEERKKNKGRRTDAVGDRPIWAALLSPQIKCERFVLQHVKTQAAKQGRTVRTHKLTRIHYIYLFTIA